MEEVQQWIKYQISHYRKQGWAKEELDERYKRFSFKVVIDNCPNYGGNALGSKTEAYFEKESDYEYIIPSYSKLSIEEKKIYTDIETVKCS